IDLIYGGGSVGLMGTIADAVLSHGGKAIGVIPRFLHEHELGHESLTELIVVETMHERKQKMIDLAEAFIAMPGGFGTLEELGEVLAWSQLGLHNGPCGTLNVNGFYDGLLAYTDRMYSDGLVRQEDRNRFLDDPSPEGLLEKMEHWAPPAELKWAHIKRENL
ncbi:MAG: LOG family protein, partial [Verrucomicrobiales bacterium]